MKNFWAKLKKPISVLAPMEDVTDFAFRELIAEVAKPDVMFTEFTSIDGLFSPGREKVIPKLDYSEKQRPIVAQIWGADPEKFGKAARLVQDLGFDGIDINMGCPDKNVMRNKAGAAMINNYTQVELVINAVKEGAPDIPLSIKTRLAKSEELTHAWFDFLIKQDIQALTIHARTAKAMSKGYPDWNQIKHTVEARNKNNPKMIIIGNGDVKSLSELREKSEVYEVDGVMVGRGIFSNPWLFSIIEGTKKHTATQKIELLEKHLELFNKKWGQNKHFDILKRFFKIYIREFDGSDDFRQKLMVCKNYHQAKVVVKTFNRKLADKDTDITPES